MWVPPNPRILAITSHGGETVSKSEYLPGNYRYFDGDEYHITKYCNKSFYGKNGYTDSLTILEPDDDAASTRWGNGARTPTSDDWIELMENTKGEVATLNGIHGYRFTSDNGNSIFLPAAGAYLGGQLEEWYPDAVKKINNTNEWGYYWTSSLNTTTPSGIIAFYISPIGCYMRSYAGGRYLGQSVRPVRSAQ